MHKRKIISQRPAAALDLQVILELALLFLRVLQEVSDLFGINFGGNDE